ncbi:MAG TPA: NADH-quinone oxidoreductase subunit NuoH [Thermoanaerobaculia bacterium]|nr:NADH-quinone oxidoreductase subunit NuoH [Thermoanaerobaculia bacterium]
MNLLDWVILVARVALPAMILPAIVIPLVWYERRVAAFIQDRPGPNRVGPFGLLQSPADILKLFMKEEVIPSQSDRFLFYLAPGLAVFSALATFAVIPYGGTLTIAGKDVPLLGADISIGVLYVFAMTSLSVYALVLAGWSSNNKFSLMGGIRSSAQLISYELAMTTAAGGVILSAGSFKLADIIAAQQGTWLGFIPRWNVFPQILGFLIFFIATFAETNRLPFDLPEAEAELVAGYHTEYSAMHFGSFFLAEYVNVIVSSALTATLYLGGWSLPGFHPHGVLGVLLSLLVFAAKTGFLVSVFVWVRWTLPRFRYDQLMALGWKVFLPLALVNLFWAAALEMWKAAR